jgi:hypothetical protein
MPDNNSIFSSIENSGIGQAIANSPTAFPWIETVHVVVTMLVVGFLIFVDLRLIGVHSKELRVTKVSRAVLPWVWGCFVIAAISGLLLFSQTAVKYANLGVFQAKMLLLLLAGVNMVIFHFVAWKDVDTWDTQIPPPPKARVAGAISLALWLSIVVVGRWIGFSLL